MPSRASMNRCIGVWIDNRSAQIFDLHNGASSWITVHSEVEPRRRRLGQRGVAPPAHLGGNLESRYQNRRDQQIRRHYDRVIAAMPADAPLLILGPGQAKTDLWKRLQAAGAGKERLIAIEAAGRITPAQLAARVRKLVRPAPIRRPSRARNPARLAPVKAG